MGMMAYGKVDLGNLIVEDQDLAEGTLIIGTGPCLGLNLNFLVRAAFRGTPQRDEAARPQQYFSRVVPTII